MTFIDDFAAAVDTYPDTDVNVTITDLTFPGAVLNVGEVATCKVRVANTGHLNMTGVSVRLYGTTYADVSTSSTGGFTSSVVVSISDVAANGAQKSAVLYLKAKAVANPAQTIAKARLEAWNANLDHILNSHSNSGPNEGALVLAISNA